MRFGNASGSWVYVAAVVSYRPDKMLTLNGLPVFLVGVFFAMLRIMLYK